MKNEERKEKKVIWQVRGELPLWRNRSGEGKGKGKERNKKKRGKLGEQLKKQNRQKEAKK